ncbi:permease-like cell division protein FtsX [Candidatus Saccharibacteria bacterium]|nr:permease-like cell division protein FtsX [Candidatus Saccharibacteria bacterium]
MSTKKPSSTTSKRPSASSKSTGRGASKGLEEIMSSINAKNSSKPLSRDGALFVSESTKNSVLSSERVLTEDRRRHPGHLTSGVQKKTKQISRRTLRALTKYKPRRLISVTRVHKYGMINFTRNAWLSLASITIMIITLLIMSATIVTQRVATDTVEAIKQQVDMSIYLQQSTSPPDVNTILEGIWALPSVTDVKYTSSQDARQDFIHNNLNNADAMAAVKEAENMFPGIINIQVADINDTSELENFIIENHVAAANLDRSRPPSFASERRAAIDTIARASNAIQIAGLIAGGIFITIAILVIFNTIRMSIFSRQDEIYMMSLIGASKSFIRGPFIVEAAIGGLLAAIVAGFILLGVLPRVLTILISHEVAAEPTFNWIQNNLVLSLGGLYLAGTLLGMIAALVATKRYLK